MVGWVKDSFPERKMKQMEIQYRQQAVSIANIDFKKSAENRARKIAINKDDVERYARDMRNGDAFPMPVLRKCGTKWVICSGNHRVTAAVDAGAVSIECYTIECSDMEFDVLAKVLNTCHGEKEDVVEQAAQLCLMHSMSPAQAAALLGVSQNTVSARVRATEVRRIAHLHGIDTTLSDTSLEMLSGLAKSEEPVLLAALRAASGRIVACREINDLRAELNEQKSEAQKLEVVEKWAKSTKPESKRVVTAPLRRQSQTAVKNLSAVIEKATILAQTQLQREDAEQMVTRLESLTSKLKHLLAVG